MLVKRRLVANSLKYALAFGLLIYVVWSNWGDPRGTAGRIVVGGETEKGKITGTVLSYQPNESIAIEESSGPPVEFALKKRGRMASLLASLFDYQGGKTKVLRSDGVPLPDGEPLPKGTRVTVSEVSRGLAYVWQSHVVRGEPIHSGYLVLAFFLALAAIMLTFARWYVLVRAVELPFRVIDAFRLGFVGLFFNTFMPGSVGGDIIKAAFLAREHSRRTVAVATVLMDRAIALWALVWFVALLGAGFWLGGLLVGQGAEQCRTIVTIAWIIVGASLVVWLGLGVLPEWRAVRFAGRLSKLPKVGHSAAEFWRAVWMYRCRPGSVYFVLLLSWIGHVGFVFLFYFAALTLWDPGSGQKIPTLTQHFLIVPIGLVISAMPFFPGGAGIGELGFGLLYEWLGCSEASGVLASLVQRVIMWVLGLLGYLVYLRMRGTLPAPASETASVEKDGLAAASARGPFEGAEKPLA
jgi:uncharacterized protein (TIRG00374 family)